MRVRLATAADVARVAEVTDAAYRPWIARIGIAPAPMAADHAADVAAGRVHVAGDPVAGVLVLVPRDGYLLLDSAAVHPDAQGTGLGRALLVLAERRAVELGLPEVRLHTHVEMVENQRLYERIGYERTGRGTEGPYDRIFYRKPLSPAV